MSSYRLERNKEGIENPRAMCFSCNRPALHCICSLIEPFKAHCNFLLLQHPHERKKYCTTSKLVLNAIKNSQILRGITFSQEEILSHCNGNTPYLLYPGKDAIDCKSLPLNENSTIIVIDGTWIEARKIVHRNPYLKQFPRISFSQPLKSQYKIRKQPKEFCLSTIECIGHLLKLNAQNSEYQSMIPKYERLFKGFNEMVTKQLSYFPRMNIAEK